ncbi:MAG: peptidylprolyl isomerase [bacterium]|nr:MAG: peptidylprolyl isomerase [bacterium]
MNLKKTGASLGLLFLIIAILNCSKDDKSKSKELTTSFSDSAVVAIVNGDAILYDDVDKAIKQFLNQLGRDANQFIIQKPDTAFWKDALDWIISIRLLAQEAYKQNIKVDKSEVDFAFNTIKRRFPSEQKFLDALEEADLTIEQFTHNLTKEIMVQKLLNYKIGSQIEDPSDEDALKYYNEHGEKFIQDEQIRVHHILLKVSETADPEKVKNVESKARRILERIKKGEDFEKLARQYSEDPSALKGGDIGFFSGGDMIKNFEDAAFALKVGEVSDLVRTPLGFHIIRLDERKTSQKIPFREVKIEIKLQLKQERSNKLLEQFVEGLKSKANIRIRDEA